MKYAIVIVDGAADLPLDELGGKTPLEAARTPNIDRLAREGLIGTVRTVPTGFTPGSDVAMMSVVGYSPERFYTGRAPLEAAGMGLTLGPHDWAARCNLVTIGDGRMVDYSAGHITPAESALIVETLNAEFGGEGLELYAGKGYRNLAVLRDAGGLDIKTTPPHDIAGQQIERYLPRGRDADVFTRLMERSRAVLAGHEVNRRRREAGQREATDVWLWGQGRATRLEPFAERFGLGAAVITAVDLVAGVCLLAGWERIEVPGATGYYDTDYAGKAAAAVKALGGFDMVLVHVEAPDEASHNRDASAKVAAIENIDSKVVDALVGEAGRYAGYRLMVLADHYTLVSTGAHGSDPVPFAMWGDGIEASGAGGFDERTAGRGERLEDGVRLLRMFIG